MNSSRKHPVQRSCCKQQSEDGGVLLTALIFLVILTLIGVLATRTAQMDIQIAANEIPYRQNFYHAEAGLYREAAELGRGEYGVVDISNPSVIAQRGYEESPKGEIPEPKTEDRHAAFGQTYDFRVRYVGFFVPPAGYDATDYARHDFTVEVTANSVDTASRLYKIGPKAE